MLTYRGNHFIIHVSQVMLYIFNLHAAIGQLYLNKTRGEQIGKLSFNHCISTQELLFLLHFYVNLEKKTILS